MIASRNVLAWFVLLLLAISTAAAAEDFTATGTGRILAFACSPAEGQLVVSNTGDVPSAYDLAAEGRAKTWVQFEPESFTLDPGQTQVVQEFFTIPCDADDQALDIVIATNELELILGQELIVQTPNNVQLIPQVFSQEILPCDPATFSFLLHNPSAFTETYHIAVEDAPEQALLSDETLTLLPLTNETIAITVRPKDCTLSGEFNPVLLIKTEKTKLQSEIGMFLRINDSDIPEIGAGVDRIRAGFAAQEAPLELVNTGNRVTTYLVRSDGPAWVTVQPEQITIDARDSEDLKLVMQPPEGTAAGAYPVTLTVIVEATGKEYTKQLTIKLGPPTFVEKLFAEYLPFAIGGIVLLIVIIILIVAGVKKYNSPEYQAKLAERRAMRDQARQERIALKEAMRKEREEEQQRAEEQEAKEAERKERELERERLKAQREYDKQLRKEHLVIPKDSIIAGVKQTGKRLWKLALLLLILILIGFGLTFKSVITQNVNALATGFIVLLAILVLHRIRRSMMARKRWKLALANTEHALNTKWKKGLTQLSFTLNTVIEKLLVTVKRCKPTIAPAEHVYQSFVITPNVDADTVSGATLTFRIKKSWLLNNRISPDAVRLLHLDNNRWQPIVAEPVSTDATYVYFKADADGFGEFAIVGKPGKRIKAAERHVGGWLMPAIFGIVLIIAIITLSFIIPGPSTPTVGIPAQVWKQDAQHTLELAQFFKDPDNDALTFSATRTENIDISIVDGKALFTPRHAWSGTERTVFVADDGKGGIVKSNPVDLVVEPPVIPASWKRYAGPIFMIAIIVLVILGIVLFRRPLKKLVGLE